MFEPANWSFFTLILITFFCEYIDSTLGMGFGTTLTPLLLLAGFEPIEIVPVILLSEFLTGITSGVLHNKFKNVNFTRDSQSLQCVYLLGGFGVIGTLIAVNLAVSVSKWLLNTYIGSMILAMGVIMLLRHNQTMAFSWGKIAVIGFISAFNKGLSGGGYGPIVTSGQIISGQDTKKAIGITSLVEGAVCLVGTLMYLLTDTVFDMDLGLPLIIGAMLSTPLAAYTVNKTNTKKLTFMIGVATSILGILTLIKLIVDVPTAVYPIILSFFVWALIITLLKG